MKIITLNNINTLQANGLSVLTTKLVLGNNTKPLYSLQEALKIVLSNDLILHVPKGFVWDLSSVPRMFWSILPPSSDAELGTLIHDFLYVNKPVGVSRKFADKEMFKWSKKVSGTYSRFSFRNFDNWLRYAGVRTFGWLVWHRLIRI